MWKPHSSPPPSLAGQATVKKEKRGWPWSKRNSTKEKQREVFVAQIEPNNRQTLSMKDLINFITTSYSSSDMNVREYFNSLEIPYACKERIAKYLDDVGA